MKPFFSLAGLSCLFMCLFCQSSALAEEMALYDFADGAGGWEVEDDVVMGGKSRGQFAVSHDGIGIFSGDVSLENNGGFSSVQYNFDPLDVSARRTFCLRVRGDGRNYRFIIEGEPGARHYYEAEFSTSGDWETVEIPFGSLKPTWRGERLDLPVFPGKTLTQLRFMIANARAESFRMEVERIWLK